FNIILDPIFNMGILGAAWATVFSAFISGVVLLYWMHYKKDTYLDLSLKNFKYNTSIITGILNVAVPSTAENLIFSALGIIENYLLVIVAGTVAVATYTAGMRLIQLSMIPLIGFGTALLTVVGASYGAKDYHKLRNAFYYTLKLGLIVSTVMAIIFFLFAPQISSVFAYSSSAQLAPRIASLIQIMIIFIYAVCLGMISAMMFQGVGKGITSFILTFIRALLLEVVFSYLFGIVFNLGEYGIYYGVVLGGFAGGLLSFTWATLYIKRLISNYD
ncbi:MAG: MATE family efflux transporter, partial [Methanosphaera sp.]|nr:MATE family efflux transporter [Methanosphaera sp.]